MKRIVMVMVAVVAFAACGDDDTSVPGLDLPAGSTETQFQVNDGGVVSRIVETATRTLRAESPDNRFDENGNLIGVYGVPYNPCDVKPCSKK